MKFIILVLASAIACASAAAIFDVTLDDSWNEFQKVHNKQYSSIEESTRRRLTWESNLKYINQHNLEHSLGKHTFTVAMNKYGDMTNKEFVSVMNGFNMTRAMQTPTEFRHSFMMPSNVKIPDSVDWRTQGYVTPIKDQGQCGSCWAFSAVASLEGQHFKKAGTLVSLSEQNLVDCSTKQGNQGCNGGLMDQAFTYIKVNKGIDTEDSYKYVARDEKCKFKAASVGATDTGFTDIDSGDETALATAIATVGPISVAIDASQSSFQFYSSGIYSDPDCSSTELDHGVTAVGYGTQGAGKDFYIVKNSWGTSWGSQGYIMIARNSNNMCGMATMSSYPMV
jgi:cathepsin L